MGRSNPLKNLLGPLSEVVIVAPGPDWPGQWQGRNPCRVEWNGCLVISLITMHRIQYKTNRDRQVCWKLRQPRDNQQVCLQGQNIYYQKFYSMALCPIHVQLNSWANFTEGSILRGKFFGKAIYAVRTIFWTPGAPSYMTSSMAACFWLAQSKG